MAIIQDESWYYKNIKDFYCQKALLPFSITSNYLDGIVVTNSTLHLFYPEAIWLQWTCPQLLISQNQKTFCYSSCNLKVDDFINDLSITLGLWFILIAIIQSLFLNLNFSEFQKADQTNSLRVSFYAVRALFLVNLHRKSQT